MIGTHEVTCYPDPDADEPTGTGVDITCLIDEVAIVHGRADSESQPVASSATMDITVGPGTPLPTGVDIGAWIVITTSVGAATSTRFTGRITDLAIGWDDAGEDTPDNGVGQIVAVGPLADYARRVIGDEPFPEELDGARVARVFALAGLVIDPATSDPGTAAIIPRDIDAKPALQVAQGTADSAGGLVWATRDGEIRYADALHRYGIEVALDIDVCDVLVTPTWTRNTDGLVNDVRVTYGVDGASTYHDTNQASKDRFGRYEYSATVDLAHATDAEALTHLILTQNGYPVWMLERLPIDVAGLTTTETETILSLDVNSLVRVGGLPATGPTPTAIVAWIEGWTERLAWGVHELELVVSDYCRTSPPPRWNDIPSTTTWNTVGSALTWDAAACLGPAPDLGTWDTVPASTRWNMVDPSVTWDTATSGGGLVPAEVAEGARHASVSA